PAAKAAGFFVNDHVLRPFRKARRIEEPTDRRQPQSSAHSFFSTSAHESHPEIWPENFKDIVQLAHISFVHRKLACAPHDDCPEYAAPAKDLLLQHVPGVLLENRHHEHLGEQVARFLLLALLKPVPDLSLDVGEPCARHGSA